MCISGVLHMYYRLMNYMCNTPQGGGYFTKCSVTGFNTKTNWTQSDLRFGENEGSKRSKINEKRINWFEKQGENCLKSVK